MKLLKLIILSALALPCMAQPESQLDAVPASERMQPTTVLQVQSPDVNNYNLKAEERIYSGIAVQLIRAPQPLQLINPLAPKSYGSGQENLVLDTRDRRPVGLKFFSINF